MKTLKILIWQSLLLLSSVDLSQLLWSKHDNFNPEKERGCLFAITLTGKA